MYHMFANLDGTTKLFTCGFDGKLKAFSMEIKKNTISHIKTQEGHNLPVNSCAVSYDGKYIISTSADLKVCLHDRKSGALVDEAKVSELPPVEEEPDVDGIEELRIRIPKN